MRKTQKTAIMTSPNHITLVNIYYNNNNNNNTSTYNDARNVV